MQRAASFVFTAVLGFALPATAATIAFVPGSLSVSPGDTFAVSLVISDVGAGNVVGDFDLDITFESSLLTVSAVALGESLGMFSLGEAIDFGLGLTSPGALNLSVVSLLSSAALAGIQTPTITLATIEFVVGPLQTGATTDILITVNALGDGTGSALAAVTTPATLSGSGASAVPEPNPVGLCLGGTIAALTVRMRPRRRT